MNTDNRAGLDPDRFWYKTGVIYELHVRAFFDSNGDGIGDFRGLTGKLDYLKDLGVTALWLLPFYPSPLRDDGYDIADYRNIHPDYGSLSDFKFFLREAHRRGLRVITELVLNHTSDRHPWFQRARRAKPGSRWRNFYVWSDTTEKYQDARIIFADLEVSNWTWDHVARAYFWHRFFSHQPDLNYDNPEVFDEMMKVLDFWLELGVDGFRLDAVPYLFERDGTGCENLPETHEALRKLRAHVDQKYGDRILLAEANQWPEDAVQFFGKGKGDECHLAFHFPLMPRLFMALRMEDRTPVLDILDQTPSIPETAQWALFLRNHDELTLETVTDEERDYMYRMYAHVHQARLNLGIRRRLAPLLGNDRRRIELLNALLFSLPGTPVLYYGDEIGMGDNIFLGDRNGVRTPMQWNSDKNAGFSRANPQALYLPIIYDPEYHYEAVNVEGQLSNPHSLLWGMRRLLALRKKWRALGEGACEFLHPDNRKILSYVLRDQKEILLAVMNLSRFAQYVELDLSAFRGCLPVELFGRTKFPAITEKPYGLTLGPHNYYWFSLEPRPGPAEVASDARPGLPALAVDGDWPDVLRKETQALFEALLPDYLRSQPWFLGKEALLKQTLIQDIISIPAGDPPAGFILLVRVEYVNRDPEAYSLPIAFVTAGDAGPLRNGFSWLILAELTLGNGRSGVLCDGMGSPAFCHALLEMVWGRRHSKGIQGELAGSRTAALRRFLADVEPSRIPITKIDPQQSTVCYGEKVVIKLFRRLEAGVNPDLEIGRFLAEKAFPNVPGFLGALEYFKENEGEFDLAMAQGFVANAKNAWTTALDTLGRYYDRVGILRVKGEEAPVGSGDLLRLSGQEASPAVQEVIGTYLESARRLAECTAALHMTLAYETDDARFVPEPFTPHYVRGLFQSMRTLATHSLRRLRKNLKAIPGEAVPTAERVLELESEWIRRYRRLFECGTHAQRIRIHGDYHLGQILWNGKDFHVLNFEGKQGLPLSERQIKRCPLRDVAGMIYSFQQVAYAGLDQHVERGSLSLERVALSEPWARFWHQSVSGAFLRKYLDEIGASELLPRKPEELRIMLHAYLLHRAMEELGEELDHRPDRLRITLQEMLHFMVENR